MTILSMFVLVACVAIFLVVFNRVSTSQTANLIVNCAAAIVVIAILLRFVGLA